MIAAEVRRAKNDLLLTKLANKARITITDKTGSSARLIYACAMTSTPGRRRAVIDFLLTPVTFVSLSTLAYKRFLFSIADAHSVVLAWVRRAVVNGKRRVVTCSSACSIVVFHEKTTALITFCRVHAVLVEAAAIFVALLLGILEALLATTAIVFGSALIVFFGAVGHVVLITGTISIALIVTLTLEATFGHASRHLGIKFLGNILVVLDLDHTSTEGIADGIHGVVLDGTVLLPLISFCWIGFTRIQGPIGLGIAFSTIATGRGIFVTKGWS